MENLVRILGAAYIFFGQGKLPPVWNAVAAILDFTAENYWGKFWNPWKALVLKKVGDTQ